MSSTARDISYQGIEDLAAELARRQEAADRAKKAADRAQKTLQQELHAVEAIKQQLIGKLTGSGPSAAPPAAVPSAAPSAAPPADLASCASSEGGVPPASVRSVRSTSSRRSAAKSPEALRKQTMPCKNGFQCPNRPGCPYAHTFDEQNRAVEALQALQAVYEADAVPLNAAMLQMVNNQGV